MLPLPHADDATPMPHDDAASLFAIFADIACLRHAALIRYATPLRRCCR